MSKKRVCKRCTSYLSEMDPHTICKSCRQPDPQMFYCSEDNCEACSVIKAYKPLDLLLRKHELENLEKKLNPLVASISNLGNSSSNFQRKNQDFPFRYTQHMGSSTVSEEQSSSSFPPNFMEQIMRGINRERNEEIHFAQQDNQNVSYPSSSKARESNLEELEKRIYERIMSNISSNLPSDRITSSSPTPVENKPPPMKIKLENKLSSPIKVLSGDDFLSSDDNDTEDSIISLFKTVNPDCLTKCSKGTNEEGKNDYMIKISSKVSDILLNLTILSSPSQASHLSAELDVEEDAGYWPMNLNAGNILLTGKTKLPNMRLHPKTRHLHCLLFGKLSPSLPREILVTNFNIPEISEELQNKFLFSREQLQRFIIMFSIVDHYSVDDKVNTNSSVKKLLNLLLNHLKVSLEKQANFLGLLMQEIRRDLLCDAECKDPLAINKLITGPIHPSQFFGPYVKVLQDKVQKKGGSSFCIYSKSQKPNINLFKLPSKYSEKEDASRFLNKLQTFFESNNTNEKDEVAIFETLLPKNILSRLADFIKPSLIGEKSFVELSTVFERILGSGSNWLMERKVFVNKKQSKGQSLLSYTQELENLVTHCNYRTTTREMLRDQFVFGLYEQNIQEHLLKKCSWSYEECYAYAFSKNKSASSVDDDVDKPSPKILRNKSISTDKKLDKPAITNTKADKPAITITKVDRAVVKITKVDRAVISPKLEKETRNSSKKRVQEDKKPSNAAKKLKLCDNTFYKMYASLESKKESNININNVTDWNQMFGFNVEYTFDVCCPWTGKILRE